MSFSNTNEDKEWYEREVETKNVGPEDENLDPDNDQEYEKVGVNPNDTHIREIEKVEEEEID